MTQQKDAGKDQRVVLNLSLEQAEVLATGLELAMGQTVYVEKRELWSTIKGRLLRTITKHKLLARFQEQGIEPTKENIAKAMAEAIQ
jgi:hypothetical protein